MPDGDVFSTDGLHVGLKLKALRNGEFVHAQIIDLSTDAAPVKVHYKGTKKKDDVWLKLSQVRLGTEHEIDWERVDDKLPTRQDPDSREARKKVFESWDANGKGTLSLKELQTGIAECLRADRDFGADVEDIDKAVKRAYDAARKLAPPKKKKNKKSADKTISKSEFHALLVAFKHYLELAELFELMDSSNEDDQKLSYRECKKELAKLEVWGITDDFLKEKFAGVDAWTPKLKFMDFASWCVECRWQAWQLKLDDSDNEEVVYEQAAYDMRSAAQIEKDDQELGAEDSANKQKVIESFKTWDSDGSGSITEAELQNVLVKLNPEFTTEKVAAMFNGADSNKDGVIHPGGACHIKQK